MQMCPLQCGTKRLLSRILVTQLTNHIQSKLLVGKNFLGLKNELELTLPLEVTLKSPVWNNLGAYADPMWLRYL